METEHYVLTADSHDDLLKFWYGLRAEQILGAKGCFVP